MLIISGCGSQSNLVLLQSQKKDTLKQHTFVQSYEYIIRPQDRLKVAIYRNPELASQTSSGSNQLGQDMQEDGILVDTRGYISLPLIGAIKVAGLTQTEASNLITRKYKKYLKIPIVYVEVLNKRIYVLGEVKKPGPIKLDHEKLTLLEAIAHAGDFTNDAIRNNIIIVSKNREGKATMRSVDLTNFDQLNFASMLLRPDDVVYVQPNGWKEYKVTSDNFTAPFRTISEIVSPLVQLKYLRD